jgi:hypothetical protein
MYRVAIGGPITINSFLTEHDRNTAREHMLKTASKQMREAAKIGLQSLYADPSEVLEKYKDFDIVKEMKARKDAKLLWVRARSIDADTVNHNGDYFSKAELLKEVEVKGEKIPAYKTFEGVPIYTNHKNDDIEQAKGMVVYAEWEESENCVYCTFFVDEEAYPDIARNIRTGVIHDVSMGCSVAYGICSKCGNKAYTEKEYCSCLKKWKGKKENGTGKSIYEENYDLKFIELSCVGDGAFDTCEIKEIYDVDDILNAATDAEKKASELIANIVVAQQGAPSDPTVRHEYEECLRVAENTARTSIKLAQSAGTLVGGQLMAGEGANQNSTVQAVLGALGIDPRAGLNILDLINLSLNFLEVAVMNMFARKDNVDLVHVGKITKSMADLQSTMQDMIDDGIDTGGGQGQQPLNQQQLQQQPQQQQPQQPQQNNVAPANYMPAGNVGRMIEPALFTSGQQGVGGAVALASSSHNLVWASKDGRREVFASTSTQPKDSSFIKLTKGLIQFKEALSDNTSIASVTQNVIRVANERNKNIRNNTPHSLRAEGNNQMDHFAKIASEQRKKLAAAVTIDFKVEDGAGNRLILSTDGSITGFTNGNRSNWEPILSEQQLSAMESGGGARVAADLLKDFVKTAIKAPHMDKDVKELELKGERKGVPYKTLADGVATMHADPNADKTREESLESLRKDNAEYGEEALTSAGLYGHKVNDADVKEALSELVAQANKGVSEEGLNERLECCRVEGSAPAHEVMVHTVEALGEAVVESYSTPSEVVEASTKLANEELLPEMIATASAGTSVRAKLASKADFFKSERVSSSPLTAVLASLGNKVSKTVTAGDLAEALKVAASEVDFTMESVTKLAELKMSNAKGSTSEAKAKVSKSEELRTALRGNVTGDALISKNDLKSVISAMAMSAEEAGVTAEEVAEEVEEMEEADMIAEVNKARTASATSARLKSRARREFWGERVASKTDLSTNVIGWLADYATNFNLSTKSIVTAAKKLVSDGELAEKLIVKAIETKQNAERTAAMQVTHETSDSIRFVCRTEDLDGLKPNDEGFEDAFRQKAMEVLQGNGFTVDPNTFSFTDLNVSAYGDITATVSSRTSKSFSAQSVSEVPMVGGEIGPEEEMGEPQVIMTEEARMARNERRSRILNRYAQMAAPGQGMGGGMAAPAAPDMGMDAGAFGGAGISAMTTDPMAADAPVDEDMDAMSEPGDKKPWGTVCPVCGSDDVDVAESKGSCNSCGSTYEIQMSLKLISDGTGGQGEKDEQPEADMGEMGGMGDLGPAAGAPVGGPMGAPAPAAPGAPAPGMPGLPPATASIKGLFRLAATVDADVYLETAKEGFTRTASRRLPIGMVCPKCGNREANKVKDTSFCHSCGNISKTTVAQNKKNPSKLDVTITWID